MHPGHIGRGVSGNHPGTSYIATKNLNWVQHMNWDCFSQLNVLIAVFLTFLLLGTLGAASTGSQPHSAQCWYSRHECHNRALYIIKERGTPFWNFCLCPWLHQHDITDITPRIIKQTVFCNLNARPKVIAHAACTLYKGIVVILYKVTLIYNAKTFKPRKRHLSYSKIRKPGS